jgi:hypothetical protein
VKNRSQDVVGDILKRIAQIGMYLTEGKVIITQDGESGDEIKEFRAYFEDFEIKVVALRFTNSKTIAEGRLGELHFDSQFPFSFSPRKDFFLNVAIEFPASGMQVWANRIPENGTITTGLAKVMYIYSHSQKISDEGLFAEFNIFAHTTNQYLEFIKSS